MTVSHRSLRWCTSHQSQTTSLEQPVFQYKCQVSHWNTTKIPKQKETLVHTDIKRISVAVSGTQRRSEAPKRVEEPRNSEYSTWRHILSATFCLALLFARRSHLYGLPQGRTTSRGSKVKSVMYVTVVIPWHDTYNSSSRMSRRCFLIFLKFSELCNDFSFRHSCTDIFQLPRLYTSRDFPLSS